MLQPTVLSRLQFYTTRNEGKVSASTRLTSPLQTPTGTGIALAKVEGHAFILPVFNHPLDS